MEGNLRFGKISPGSYESVRKMWKKLQEFGIHLIFHYIRGEVNYVNPLARILLLQKITYLFNTLWINNL